MSKENRVFLKDKAYLDLTMTQKKARFGNNLENQILIRYPEFDQPLPSGSTNNIGIGRYIFDSLEDGSRNIAIGCNAGRMITTSDNILIGHDPQRYASGGRNILIGNYTGKYVDGNDNVMVGYTEDQEVEGTLDLNRSVFFGYASGNSIVGNDNIGIGYYASDGDGFVEAHRNIGIGYYTLEEIDNDDDCNDNIAIGTRAGSQLYEGEQNIFIGAYAGDDDVNDETEYTDRSIFIGAGASVDEYDSEYTDLIVIGYGVDDPDDGDGYFAFGSDEDGRTHLISGRSHATVASQEVYIDARAKLTYLRIPTTAPSVPVAGDMYLSGTNVIIYDNVNSAKTITTTAVVG